MVRSTLQFFCHLVLGASILISAGASAQYSTYTTIGFPAGGNVRGWGLNAKAHVTVQHETTGDGFIYDLAGNVFQGLPPGVTPMGINDDGTVTGSLSDGTSTLGFISNGGSLNKFAHPAGGDTFGRGISSKGLVAGYTVLPGSSTPIGFIYDPKADSFTNILVSGAQLNIAQGINSAGSVVGSVNLPANAAYTGSPAGAYGYFREFNGALTLFRVNGLPTRARGINDEGMVTGWFTDPVTSTNKSFVIKLSISGAFANVPVATSSILEVPGSSNTIAEGINAMGEVSGIAHFPNGSTTAFVASSPASIKPF